MNARIGGIQSVQAQLRMTCTGTCLTSCSWLNDAAWMPIISCRIWQLSNLSCCMFHIRLDVPDAEEKARTFVVEAVEKLWIYDLWFLSSFESVNWNSTGMYNITMQNDMSTASFEVQTPGTRVISTIFHLLAPRITAWCVEIICVKSGSKKGPASGQAMKNKVLRETWPDPEEPDEWRGLTEISLRCRLLKDISLAILNRDVSYHPPECNLHALMLFGICILILYIILYL